MHTLLNNLNLGVAKQVYEQTLENIQINVQFMKISEHQLEKFLSSNHSKLSYKWFLYIKSLPGV